MRAWDFQPRCQAGNACMLERWRALFSETGLEAGRRRSGDGKAVQRLPGKRYLQGENSSSA